MVGIIRKALSSALLLLLLLLLLLCSNGDASHVLYKDLQSTGTVNSKLRTGFHFQPPKNWINDPNGPMLYKDVYHMFYQYNPYAAVWGNILWAHSVSYDMINWFPLKPPIYPTKPFDINGCWSGSVTFLPDGTPALIYTGVDQYNRQVQNVALPADPSDPFLRDWVKPDYNPIIFPGDSGVNASAFRDPTSAWRGPDGVWRVVVGTRDGETGISALYKSKDFVKWEKSERPLHSVRDVGMWECPDFYPVAVGTQNGIDDGATYAKHEKWELKYVHKVSLDELRYDYYTIGAYNYTVDQYVPEPGSVDDHTGLRYDYGNLYATKTFYDDNNWRRVLVGWSNESDTVHDDVDKGWSGIQIIPRTVWLDEISGKQVKQWPITEVEFLRGKNTSVHKMLVKTGQTVEIQGIHTAQADVEVTFEVTSSILSRAEEFNSTWIRDPQALCAKEGAYVKSGGVGPFGLYVLASIALEEKTAVFFRVFKHGDKYVTLMCNDPTSSSYSPHLYKPTFAGFVDSDIGNTGKISLRTLIDNSVVESFGEGGKTCITSRVYPSIAVGADAHLFVFNGGGGDVMVSSLTAWEMRRALMNGI